MRNFFVVCVVALMTIFNCSAKEGMWMPLLLQILNEKDMQEAGLKLSAEDIYSVNHSCLKDAVMIFGGGCTGEVVSNEGLLLTNHHCGYGSIQRLSSIDYDYLTDGFWAMQRNEELPCQGLTVSFLIRMDDVTNKVLDGVDDNLSQAERENIIKERCKSIEKEAVEGTHYKAEVEPFFYGNEYYLFVYEVFKDVRLVGAPPSNIGKFGGDTDNWEWPRHTGDFSVFRIYADNDNNPAEYSADNKPYTPRNFLKISLDGVKQDDFTFVFGYPGYTNEYLPAAAVAFITEVDNPILIDAAGKRIEIMKNYSAQSPTVRLQYAGKIASIANGWKKRIGESLGIKRIDGVQQKLNYEDAFQDWAESQNKYTNVIPTLNEAYENLNPYKAAARYITQTMLAVEVISFAGKSRKLVNTSIDDPKNKEAIQQNINNLKSSAAAFFKNYYQPIDEEVCAVLLQMFFEGVSPEFIPEELNDLMQRFDNDYVAVSDYLFDKSMFCNIEKLNNFLDTYKPSHYKKITKDPAYIIYNSLLNMYNDDIISEIAYYQGNIDSTMRLYMKAQREFESDKTFYPDANFTLRITYGYVDGFKAQDAINYNYFTTLDGVMEKENPDIYDYVVEDKLKELYQNKDFGRYADKEDGKIHTCFIATNHTTGGNSGSPVLNAYGNLVGLNFDRNWQGTMSDIMYDPDKCRNIALDIRYCLFIIDKFAGASHLIDEMTIVENY